MHPWEVVQLHSQKCLGSGRQTHEYREGLLNYWKTQKGLLWFVWKVFMESRLLPLLEAFFINKKHDLKRVLCLLPINRSKAGGVGALALVSSQAWPGIFIIFKGIVVFVCNEPKKLLPSLDSGSK
jgi:hypothetical protein